MVISNKLWMPQEYLGKITDNYVTPQGRTIIEGIQKQLEKYGYDNLWDYPLSEIDHILENELTVVLVDCSYYEQGEYISQCRWFEVPETCITKFTEEN